MTPHDATSRRWKKSAGRDCGIALILGAVFVPTAFIPGNYRETVSAVPVTIAVSVCLLGLQCIDTEPGSVGHVLATKKEARGPLGAVLRGFNRVLEELQTDTSILVSTSSTKRVFAFLLMLAFVVGVGLLRTQETGGASG